MIYLDNAATTPLDANVIQLINELMITNYGNASSLHLLGRKSKKILNSSREGIASYINSNSSNLIFTSGGTESNNIVIKSLINQYSFKGYNIIVSKVEHHSVLLAADYLKNFGFSVQYLNVLQNGLVDMDHLKEILNEKTVLVSVMLVNNEIGTIQPIKELVEIVKSFNDECLFHTDAVQAIGHMKVDVEDLNIDFLSASAHKFNGPKGTGFLYVKDLNFINLLSHGGGQEFGLRSGTEDIINIAAMTLALKNNIYKLNENEVYIKSLEKEFYSILKNNEVPFIVNGSRELRIPGNVNVSINGCDGEGLLNLMDMHDICISTGSACNSEDKEPSHVLLGINASPHRIEEAIRISIGKQNTIDDIRKLAKVLCNYYNKLSKVGKNND